MNESKEKVEEEGFYSYNADDFEKKYGEKEAEPSVAEIDQQMKNMDGDLNMLNEQFT